MKVITSKEMARIDNESKVPAEILMERAGKGLADFISDYMPGYPVVFICGKGNNGGDGFVAARYLEKRGARVAVYMTVEKEYIKGLPLKQLKQLKVPVKKLNKKNLKYIMGDNIITVDCILGTGFKPPLGKRLSSILEIINKNSKIILSCDIPTGVNGATGKADKLAIEADVTVTPEYPKYGHITGEGNALTGSLEVVNIGTALSPNKYRKDFEITARRDIPGYFKRRKKVSHKKDYGHLLILGGSRGLPSAPIMAARGALRAGAGLVTCAVPEGIEGNLNNMPLSAMVMPIEENSYGTVKVESAGTILDFIRRRKIDALVIGPGLGVNKDTAEAVKILLKEAGCPVLVDADGLNSLGGDIGVIKTRAAVTVLTPHPGEMARLIGESIDKIQGDRLQSAEKLAAELRATILLKGYRTVISDGEETFLNVTGNPSMAVGGAGDILSGITGALIGQGMDGFQSAKTAAWVNGRSADIAFWKYGPRYLNPEEILGEIYRV